MELAPYLFGTHIFFVRSGETVNHAVGSASRSLTGNVATIVTATAHGLYTGATVALTGFTNVTFNVADKTVTVVNATTFTIPITAADVPNAADTGGTITQSGLVSKTCRPGPSDTGWTSMGIVESSSDASEETPIEVWRPSPGVLVLDDEITNRVKLGVKFTTSEFGLITCEMLYRTLKLTSTTSQQFNPLEAASKKGWLKVQRYDQDNVLRMVIDLWVKLAVEGDVTMGGDLTKANFVAKVLHSTLNTGLLT